jgi:hypothetical protein|tara:strand:+ start:1839 stop:1973 length:135 start_codon:yes stop_codon:yes gene_type:complete
MELCETLSKSGETSALINMLLNMPDFGIFTRRGFNYQVQQWLND